MLTHDKNARFSYTFLKGGFCVKKTLVVTMLILSVLLIVINDRFLSLSTSIIGILLFYIAYDIIINKNYTFANLVRNNKKPTQVDTNIGLATGTFSFILGLIFIIISFINK